jgi:Ca-activated chloride channel family protein
MQAPMRHVCHALIVAVLALNGLTIQAGSQRPAFRSAVDLVLLNVTVTDANGRFVGDLTPDDFRVLEEGRPQTITFFSPALVPLSVSLLMDTSSSMDDRMPWAQQAAADFVSRLRPADVAEVVSFDSRVEVLQPFTNDKTLLDAAIRRTKAGGSTALYNAVYIALKQTGRLRPAATEDIRRHVIVLLSDGEDTSSIVGFDQMLDLAKRSQTVIYTIGLGLEETTATKRSETDFLLRQLSLETGGRLFTPKRPEDLLDVYGRIAQELTSQYLIGYLSTDVSPTTGWRRIAVTVRRPNVQARTRSGYYTSDP